ncbi:MAG: hypothetical protein HGJ93_09060 [Desulfosarcina sp.]|nr:hypothetical protein [Desulfosarcina sp.]MBC2766092.1 hypothetical protein [Desulfosarcina sp.]
MAEATISAYEKFIIESAEQYLQTVVLIDDRIYENKRGSVVSRLTKPSAVGRKAALKSAISSSDKSGKEIEKMEAPEKPDEVSFHDVQNSFAKKRIICSLYQPKKSASFGEQSEVYKLCSTADVVIVDWDLDDPSGDKATTLVGSLVAQSRVEMPYQLRLVLIYTLDPNLQFVANKIFEHLVGLLSEEDVAVDPQSEGLVITTENARVVVLGKREGTTLDQFSDYWVPERSLATRAIKEFSQLASGLLQGIVLRGVANLRKNNRRILTRFRKDLDIAFLTHRVLLLPDEAFRQIIPLLTDELHAVLEDTLGEFPLGNASAIKKILDDWCDKHWKVSTNVELNIGAGANDMEFVKDVFCNGPAIKKDYSKIQGSKIPGLIEKRDNAHPKWKEKECHKLAKYLLGDCEKVHCHEKLGSLMSQRVRYNNSRRALHLGVIVRELADKKRYLLCLQPVCDSVRIEGKSQTFIFSILNEAEDGKRFTHCVLDGGGNVIKLAYQSKVFGVLVSNFSGTDAVYAKKNDTNRFIFKDENKEDYEWIAELKNEHAQRAAEQFGRELSRVGLTESEWLRIKAK